MKIETYLGFDVGTKRTGVAIANSLTHQANGLDVVSHHKNGATNWKGFDAIIQQHTIDLFVVGVPYDQDGKEQEMTFIAKSFGRKLSARYNIDMVFVDEYLSSNEAKKQLKYNHHHKNASRGEVDKLSAALILQTWLGDS
ncbi:Holliday junction resolvase [Candidatus Thioglobus autotrophicus]|uniref:Putative pre-16S rRNA nuclease n=1 Tax=Candidatus Thioglobus autotrophicus TaxID=1705394 RepID=A0A0M4NX30_9GAMM|nr:Holliday junction resolvase RuvX [Candidatus Thioglobus autotrophicus]ALE52502.1 Holliday junction resolvase [Candidatus Thioglobus autotrophicus]